MNKRNRGQEIVNAFICFIITAIGVLVFAAMMVFLS